MTQPDIDRPACRAVRNVSVNPTSGEQSQHLQLAAVSGSPLRHGGGEQHADRYDSGTASWLPALLTLPVPLPQNQIVPEPTTVISCARNAPGLGWHGLASTSFSVRVTGKLPRIPR